MDINFSDFKKVELRIGTIIEAEFFKEAINPSYIMKIDLGKKIGVKKTSAQITALYKISDLIGKKVIVVVNLKPKKIGPFISECLVTGFYTKNGAVVLAVPDKAVDNGSLLL